MVTHSSILAWRIPRTEEPGGLLSMGSHRVGLVLLIRVMFSVPGQDHGQPLSQGVQTSSISALGHMYSMSLPSTSGEYEPELWNPVWVLEPQFAYL